MAGGIRIPVSADLDKGDLAKTIADFTAQMNKLGSTVAQLNKLKFNPVDKAAMQDLQRVQQQFEALKKINPDLRRRLNATGQSGASMHEVDWSRVYSGGSGVHRVYDYTTAGTAFSWRLQATPATPPPGGSGNGHGGGAGGGSGGGGGGGGGGYYPGQNIVNAGLHAAGPVGGVAARSISAGMSGGLLAGAGAMLGGLAALGVGKAVSAVREKVGDAEQEYIRYDDLKRVLGDVNVSFETLRDSLRHSAAALDSTFDETQRLGAEFAKIANVGSGGAAGIHRELMIGGGLARSLGLDLGAGTGLLAQARVSKVTSDETGSKRLALMIGEAVGKVGFAKADELLSVVTGFIGSQTRAGLSAANVSGYLGALSGMAGSGRAGLDVQNSASILSRANSAIMGGGAAGEAGNNFLMAALDRQMGLNPVQVRLLQQQGLFGTSASTFGKGSLYAEYTGHAMAGSNTTNLSAIMGSLRRQYGGNKDMLLNATSNLLGLNETQAMALLVHGQGGNLGVIEGRLGRLGVGLNQLSGTGIAALAKINGGSLGDLQAQAASLFSRKGGDSLTPQEAKRLEEAMSSGDVERMKDVLTELTATREQEKTEGSETRKSINAVERTTQEFAGKLVPLANDIRDAVVAMAAKLAPDSKFGIAAKQLDAIKAYDKQEAEGRAKLEEFDANMAAARKKPEYAAMTPAMRERWEQGQALERERLAAIAQRNNGYSGKYDSSADALVAGIMQAESGGNHYNRDGSIKTSAKGARGLMQLMPETARNPGFGIQGVRDDSPEENLRVGKEYFRALMRRYSGDKARALGAYNWGMGNVDSAIGMHGDDWLKHAPAETQAYVSKILRGGGGSTMPDTGAGAGRGSTEAYAHIRIDVNDGKKVTTTNTRAKFGPPQAAGTQ